MKKEKKEFFENNQRPKLSEQINLNSQRLESESYKEYKKRLRENKQKEKDYLNPGTYGRRVNTTGSYHKNRFDTMFTRNRIFSHLQTVDLYTAKDGKSIKTGKQRFIKHYR